MANPRNIRFYDELNYHGSTFQGDNTITFTQVPTFGSNKSPQIGLAVTAVGNGQVGLGVTGNKLLGKIKTVEADLNCTVQDQGYMTLPYPANDGTVPVVDGMVVVNGAGQVIASTTTNGNIVVAVDTVNKIATIELR